MGIKIIVSTAIIVLILAFFANSEVCAMRNPAAVYCEALGYTYEIQKTELGDLGLCKLPNGEKVDAWKFLEGKVAQDYSYCRKHGYDIKTISGDLCLMRIQSEECAVCVVEGEMREVTDLMELNFEETSCGDGVCGLPENYKTCPKDCPSGSFDFYCDAVKDGKIDPDCAEGSDPDYTAVNPTTYTPAKSTPGFETVSIIIAFLMVTYVYKLLRRK